LAVLQDMLHIVRLTASDLLLMVALCNREDRYIFAL